MEDTRSKRSPELLNLLAFTGPQTDACVPAAVSMIRKSPHYGLEVVYKIPRGVSEPASGEGLRSVHKKCTRAIVLVVAPNASKMEKLNEGFQMSTGGVFDVLDREFTCNLIAFCSLQTAPDYQLKPKRGSDGTLAFVTITDLLLPGSDGNPATFLAESIEKVPDEDAAAAPEHLRRTIHFAALAADQQGSNTSRRWTEELSPAHAGKCSRLGKAPTDELLEAYGNLA